MWELFRIARWKRLGAYWEDTEKIRLGFPALPGTFGVNAHLRVWCMYSEAFIETYEYRYLMTDKSVIYPIYRKYSDRQIWANSVDPDQTLQNTERKVW